MFSFKWRDGLILLLASCTMIGMAGNCIRKTPALITPQPAVFPGAEGFGTQSRAGRGGQIIHVTNLNDSGVGSLRAALEYPRPRIVVFDVGGVIKLNSDLQISSPYITVAGQTAPGNGIMIRDYGLRITAHDVLVRHVAIRVGDDGRFRDKSWDNADCLQILGGYNIVIDHVSASWGIDENISVWGSNIHDLTISNCLIAEGLQNSVHTEGRHSKGLLIGGKGNNPKNVAIIKNLFAHNHERNPQLKGGTTAVVANNLVYNSNNQYSWILASRDKVEETNLGSFIGNVGKDGPDALNATFIRISPTILPGSRFYQEDNLHLSRPWATFKDGAQVMVESAPVAFSPHRILPAGETMDHVLRNAGSRPACRDAVDDRIANPEAGEIVRGAGSVRDHSAGLWPSYPTVHLPFMTGISPHGDFDGDGYSNVEELLHKAAARVEGR
jgi:pectate lyase